MNNKIEAKKSVNLIKEIDAMQKMTVWVIPERSYAWDYRRLSSRKDNQIVWDAFIKSEICL